LEGVVTLSRHRGSGIAARISLALLILAVSAHAMAEPAIVSRREFRRYWAIM
jgi:hypothetical protein